MFLQPYRPGVVLADYGMAQVAEDSYNSNISEICEDSGYSDCSEPSTPPTSPMPVTPNVVDVVFIFYPFYSSYQDPVCEAEPEQVIDEPNTPTTNKRRLIKWNLPPPVVPPGQLPGWHCMPYGLEVYWQSAFAWFFNPIFTSTGHLWTLTPVVQPPTVDEWHWHYTTYSAKVRFQCESRHGWTSMKGRVVFWYRIRRQGDRINCEAVFKLFGQLCNRCSNSQDFLYPLWYQEEIENAVRHLSNQVSEHYYGGPKAPQPRRLRQGCPVRHHDPERCQACFEGICARNQ